MLHMQLTCDCYCNAHHVLRLFAFWLRQRASRNVPPGFTCAEPCHEPGLPTASTRSSTDSMVSRRAYNAPGKHNMLKQAGTNTCLRPDD